jgi:hypothetical protein
MSSINEALRETAMMVTLTISAWNPVRVDRTLSTDVADARDSTARAFSVHKRLLVGAAQHFKNLSSIRSRFRAYHYSRTLPADTSDGPADRGPRYLANRHFFAYASELAKARLDMDKALAEAKAVYAQSVETARINLGKAFNPGDYPEPDQLDKLFSIKADFSPVPDGRGFRGLDADTLEKLSEYTDKKLAKSMRAATAGLSERVTVYLKRLQERLSALDDTLGVDGARKATIRNSLFDEARNIADLIEGFDFAGDDTRLADAVTLLRDVASHDATAIERADIRSDLLVRARALDACFE